MPANNNSDILLEVFGKMAKEAEKGPIEKVLSKKVTF